MAISDESAYCSTWLLISWQVFCDFHGHSRKKNVFMYGCSAGMSYTPEDMDQYSLTGRDGRKVEDTSYKVRPAFVPPPKKKPDIYRCPENLRYLFQILGVFVCHFKDTWVVPFDKIILSLLGNDNTLFLKYVWVHLLTYTDKLVKCMQHCRGTGCLTYALISHDISSLACITWVPMVEVHNVWTFSKYQKRKRDL